MHFSQLNSAKGETIEYYRDLESRDETADAKISGAYPRGFWTHWVDSDQFEFTFTTQSNEDREADLQRQMLTEDELSAAIAALKDKDGFQIDRVEYVGTPTAEPMFSRQ